MFVSQVIEWQLLSIIVRLARDLASPPANLWFNVWKERGQGNLETAVPPDPNLFVAIVEVARSSNGGPSEVLRAALQASQPSDALQIDAALFQEIVAEARRKHFHESPLYGSIGLPVAELSPSEVFANAWAERAQYRPWPIRTPAREYVAAIVNESRVEDDLTVILNKAKATFLVHLLGGGELSLPVDTTSAFVETPLFEAILESALSHLPTDWDWIHEARIQEHDRCRDQGATWRCNQDVETRFQSRVLTRINEAASQIWSDALLLRADRWDVPWPPRAPDRPLLKSLILAIWMNRGVAVAMDETARRLLLAAALEQLNRIDHSDGEHLGKVQAPLLDAAVGAALLIGLGIILGAGATLGIVAYCLGPAGRQTCANVANWVADLFKDDDAGTPMAVPPKRPDRREEPKEPPAEPMDPMNPVAPEAPDASTGLVDPNVPLRPLPGPAGNPPDKASTARESTDPSRPDYMPLECGDCEWEVRVRPVNDARLAQTVSHAYINVARPACKGEPVGFWLFEAGPRADKPNVTGAGIQLRHEFLGAAIGGGIWPRPCKDLVNCLSDALITYNQMELPYHYKNGPNSNSFAEHLVFKCGLAPVFWEQAVLPQWNYWRKHPRPF